MANQMVALQARGPQLPDMGALTTRFGNMMAQQQVANRQAAAAQQSADFARAEEGRKKELQPSALAEGTAKATAEQIKTAQLFNQAIFTAAANSNSPDDFTAFAQRIAAAPQFQDKVFFGGLQEVLASMPTDPAKFPDWQRQTGIKSIEAEKRYKNTIQPQNLGTSTRLLRTSDYGGGAAEVVPGSEAAVTMKPTVVNVEGIGAVIVDPNTGQGYPAAAGATGGYRPPVAGGDIVGGPRGGVMPTAPMGAPARGATPVATALQTNPGAIKDGSFARSQPGYAGASGGFATFDTPQAGIGAQENLLRKDYVGKGFNTIDKIISRYAPPGGENAPAAVANYKNYVAQRSGIDVNAPITAAQVPVLAAAMREFETGARPGGTPVRGGAAAPAAPQTLAQTAKTADRARTVTEFKNITGTDFTSKTDPVADLIKRSTSGGGEKLGADIMGFIPESMGGGATPGMKAIGALEVIGSDLTLALLPGNKLGAGVSNEDRKMFEKLVGEMQNPSIPAGKRLAAWGQLKTKMARIAGVETPPASKTPPGERRTPTTSAGPPDAAVQMLIKNPALRNRFDQKYGVGAAAKILKGR